MKDDRLYVIHVLESIRLIEAYTADGKEFFLRDVKTQDSVMRRLQTLAESTRRMSNELKQRYPEVDWRAIAGFRNVAVHDYLGIDLGEVWHIVEQDVPGLKQAVEAMLKEFGRQA